MTRDEWEQVERTLNDSKVVLAMRARCEEQGHDKCPHWVIGYLLKGAAVGYCGLAGDTR